VRSPCTTPASALPARARIDPRPPQAASADRWERSQCPDLVQSRQAGLVAVSGKPHTVGAVIAKVEPLTTARALRGPFDYLLTGPLEDVGVGAMLVVPFGARRLLGVVVEVAERSELAPERLAEPLAALEADVPPELVRLGLWVAQEYVSTPARGLALVLPPGTGTGAGRRMVARRSLTATLTGAGRQAAESGGALEGAPARLGERQRAALHALGKRPLRVSSLARETGCDHAGVRRLEQRGLVSLERALEPLRRPSLRAVGASAEVRRLTSAQEGALAEVMRRIERELDLEDSRLEI